MIESSLNSRLARLAKKDGVFYQRIETPGTGLGVPDLFVLVAGRAIWIELKVGKFQTKRGKSDLYTAKRFVPDWRPGQISWAVRYIRSGGSWRLIFAVGAEMFYSSHALLDYEIGRTAFPFPSFWDHGFTD
jgi:hypothetical protein